MREDAFSSYNPVINFVFYIGALVFGMVFVHPAFLLCSVTAAMAYYITVSGRKAFRMMAGLIPVFLVISLVNPLLNVSGATVLFTVFGRPYTLEALYYGMSTGGMFVGIILWFASYSAVMTSDKFMYIFGRLAPSVSLVLTMILRLIPAFGQKAKQIAGARRAIGKYGGTAPVKERISDGITIISTLTGWALEGGIVTGDSMRSRGYGCGRRTSFSVYSISKRDIVLLGIMLLLTAFVIFCGINGAAKASFTPELYIAGREMKLFVPAVAAYFILLITPTVLNIAEEIKWRILRSGI